MVKDQGQWLTVIDYCQRELKTLHERYEKDQQHFLSPADYQAYRRLAMYIHQYNETVRAMTFASVYEISRIHIAMLSRWIGFAQDWERDMYFLLSAWANQKKISLGASVVEGIFIKGTVCGNLCKALKGNDLSAFNSIYGKGTERNLNYIWIRNRIAHLHLLRCSGWDQDKYIGPSLSVVECYLNRLRKLLYYDAKRMNSVTRAMQKTMQQHKLEIQFSMGKGGELQIESIQSDEITHLKELRRDRNNTEHKPIPIPSHCAAFDQTLWKLIKYHP